MNPLTLVWLYRAAVSTVTALLVMALVGACCGLVIGSAVLTYRWIAQ